VGANQPAQRPSSPGHGLEVDDRAEVMSLLAAVHFAIDSPASTDASLAGSLGWQIVFVSFAVILILFEFIRGWRLGLMRQIARLGGVGAACAAGYFGHRIFVPIWRSFLKLPDPVLSILSGAALALATYAAVNGLGAILFRRTSQLDSFLARWISGLAGAVVGIFFGLFILLLVMVSLRAAGAMAEGRLRSGAPSDAAAASGVSRPLEARRRLLSDNEDESAALAASLMRLKNSVERSLLGNALRQLDPVSQNSYETLGKFAAVLSNPERLRRFLSFPGAHQLSEHPKIAILRDDPEIAEAVAHGRFLDLLQNPRIIEAANDPVIAERIKKFQFEQALDYALGQDSSRRESVAPLKRKPF
jgi:uncharacterized membrane protein required for colicin V production